LGLDALLDRKPRELSGGQRQRVALGRALIRKPAVFLMDEPLSNLDATLRLDLREEIKRLHRESSTTTVYVTHDQEEAMVLSDRIAVLRAGRIQQCAAPAELYANPHDTFVAQFVGSPPMNLVRGEVLQDNVIASSAMRGRDPSHLWCGVRPHHIQVHACAQRGAWQGRVVMVEPLGADTWIIAEVEHARLKGRMAQSQSLALGDTAYFVFSPQSVYCFDRQTGKLVG
jgi:ABC-type sugar transport system ATPase subunit